MGDGSDGHLVVFEPISQRKPIRRANPEMNILVEVSIEIPEGARINGIYREDRKVTVQMWATPEAKKQILVMLTGVDE